MAMDMLKEKLITADTAVTRVSAAQLDELLHPIIDPKKEKDTPILVKGLPAGPGGAVGQVVLTAEDAVEWAKQGKKVILVREETNPEDVEGMRAAEGILTARGRHDLARGTRGPRLGQVLHRRRRRRCTSTRQAAPSP